MLQKYEFFEDEAVTGAIALSSSFLAIAGIYFFLPENIFANFGGILAFAAFGVLGFLIVMAIAGIDISEMEGRIGKIPLAVGLGILGIGLLAMAAGAFPVEEVVREVNIDANLVDDVLMPIILLVFIIAIVAVSSS